MSKNGKRVALIFAHQIELRDAKTGKVHAVRSRIPAPLTWEQTETKLIVRHGARAWSWPTPADKRVRFVAHPHGHLVMEDAREHPRTHRVLGTVRLVDGELVIRTLDGLVDTTGTPRDMFSAHAACMPVIGDRQPDDPRCLLDSRETPFNWSALEPRLLRPGLMDKLLFGKPIITWAQSR